jgi:hypothetical protein
VPQHLFTIRTATGGFIVSTVDEMDGDEEEYVFTSPVEAFVFLRDGVGASVRIAPGPSPEAPSDPYR